ncbi:MAG TPA: SRPBCC domain-containing protein [Alphaproteobacteria bacterium]|nr:SRPBCC domain-containing protein [Alphaproteobacteria bacterium]
MKFDGEISVRAGREAVFEKLRDARAFASCVEGVGALSEIDGSHYTATLETRIAYMRFKFAVAVEVTNLDPPRLIEAKVEGTPVGVVGRLTAASTTTLEQTGEETLIRYAVDVSLAGKLGAMGQPVLRSKAREMEKSFAANLRRMVEAPAEASS